MTKVNIFQGYYDEKSRQYLDADASPVDVSFNLNHPLYEYNIFKTLLANGTMNPKEGPCGLVSWKFGTKTLIDIATFRDFCTRAFENGVDVAFINPMIGAESLYANVWEQGEHVGHTGMLQIFDALFSAREKELSNLMPERVFAFCNYFVGGQGFWSRYISFCDDMLTRIASFEESNPAIYQRIYRSALYARNDAIDFRPFILERLFSTFLLLHPEIVAASFEYDKPAIYEKKFGKESGKYLHTLSELKNLAIHNQKTEFLMRWNQARGVMLNAPDVITKIWMMDDPQPR